MLDEADVLITDGEVDVQDVVESLIVDQKSGAFVKNVLEDGGYWGYVPFALQVIGLPHRFTVETGPYIARRNQRSHHGA